MAGLGGGLGLLSQELRSSLLHWVVITVNNEGAVLSVDLYFLLLCLRQVGSSFSKSCCRKNERPFCVKAKLGRGLEGRSLRAVWLQMGAGEEAGCVQEGWSWALDIALSWPCPAQCLGSWAAMSKSCVYTSKQGRKQEMSFLLIASLRLQVTGSLRIQEKQGGERSSQTKLSSLSFLGPFLAFLICPNHPDRLQRPTPSTATMPSKQDSQLPHSCGSP